MFARILMISSILLLLASLANSDDLYKIKIASENNAQILLYSGVEPVLRISDGYLALLNKERADELIGAGIEVELLATDINREQLAIDNRLDQKNKGKFPLLYEEGNLRLYRADFALNLSNQEPVELAPLPSSIGKIEYELSSGLMTFADRGGLPLDSLIGLINQDSLYNYTLILQNYVGSRYTGTSGNYASRDWIADKLRSFGYDSVVYDSFMASVQGVQTACQNVVAVKVGSLYPDHEIIVGAHRDAVKISPGADDNGSGTAGVLEVARILSELNTDLTFKFILFDAEEQGLYGSYHYANEAYARGDSIVYMCNMDMIGYNGNYGQVKLYHGTKLSYSQLWQRLADSLGLVAGVLSGASGGSDHYPFTQKGYDATLVIEYVFSNVYHTQDDKVDYMSFEYMKRLVQASLATVYRINTSYQPAGALTFGYPDGVPSGLIPSTPTLINISIGNTYGAILKPASCSLVYSLNEGVFQMLPASQIDPTNFQATLPGFQCISRLRYYFSILDTLGRTFYGPTGGLRHLSVAANYETIKMQDNFESDQGWTVSGSATNGQWVRGIPNGNGIDGVPISDYDGSGQCYLTGLPVGSNVDNGSTILTSPLFDLSGGNGRISYARWYSNNTGINPLNDVMAVYISNNDGASWSTVESAGPTNQASGEWYEYAFWVNNVITPSGQMRLRFEVSDAGSPSIIEAALDKILISSYRCGACGDADNSGRINLLDVSFVISYLYRGGAAPNPLSVADVDGNGIINLLDISYIIDFLYRGGPAPQCP
jgi:hypothetical protein